MRAVLLPTITRRDWNDVIKFPGRFESIAYDNTAGNYIVAHRASCLARPDIPAGGTYLELVDDLIVIRNMSTTETAILRTGINALTIDFPIYPGLMIAIPNPDPFVYQPRLRVDSAVSNTPAECEVFMIGIYSAEPQ
jgi:hypothetical protein